MQRKFVFKSGDIVEISKTRRTTQDNSLFVVKKNRSTVVFDIVPHSEANERYRLICKQLEKKAI